MAGPELVEIGFSGGQVIAVRLEASKLKDLRRALEADQGWTELETPNGVVALDLSQVQFVRTDAPPQTVGFTG
ncbi:MAG: hypothetical protein K0S15_1405 [Solirubrobacterales bacterium]|jgi:hypothetical protein|nr:hypothetical protein [Solirubrobacterales bacterium]